MRRRMIGDWRREGKKQKAVGGKQQAVSRGQKQEVRKGKRKTEDRGGKEPKSQKAWPEFVEGSKGLRARRKDIKVLGDMGVGKKRRARKDWLLDLPAFDSETSNSLEVSNVVCDRNEVVSHGSCSDENVSVINQPSERY